MFDNHTERNPPQKKEKVNAVLICYFGYSVGIVGLSSLRTAATGNNADETGELKPKQ